MVQVATPYYAAWAIISTQSPVRAETISTSRRLPSSPLFQILESASTNGNPSMVPVYFPRIFNQLAAVFMKVAVAERLEVLALDTVRGLHEPKK